MWRLFRWWRRSGGDLALLWFALHHRDCPAWLWPAAIVLATYALEPFNVAIPVLGVVDDLILLPLVLRGLLKLLPATIREDYERRPRARRTA